MNLIRSPGVRQLSYKGDGEWYALLHPMAVHLLPAYHVRHNSQDNRNDHT